MRKAVQATPAAGRTASPLPRPCARRAAPADPVSRRSGSAMASAAVKRGLMLSPASWKTIWMRARSDRGRRSSPAASASSRVPKRIEPVGRVGQARDQPHQGGLAAAAFADQPQCLAPRHGEVDVVHCMHHRGAAAAEQLAAPRGKRLTIPRRPAGSASASRGVGGCQIPLTPRSMRIPAGDAVRRGQIAPDQRRVAFGQALGSSGRRSGRAAGRRGAGRAGCRADWSAIGQVAGRGRRRRQQPARVGVAGCCEQRGGRRRPRRCGRHA